MSEVTFADVIRSEDHIPISCVITQSVSASKLIDIFKIEAGHRNLLSIGFLWGNKCQVPKLLLKRRSYRIGGKKIEVLEDFAKTLQKLPSDTQKTKVSHHSPSSGRAANQVPGSVAASQLGFLHLQWLLGLITCADSSKDSWLRLYRAAHGPRACSFQWGLFLGSGQAAHRCALLPPSLPSSHPKPIAQRCPA